MAIGVGWAGAFGRNRDERRDELRRVGCRLGVQRLEGLDRGVQCVKPRLVRMTAAALQNAEHGAPSAACATCSIELAASAWAAPFKLCSSRAQTTEKRPPARPEAASQHYLRSTLTHCRLRFRMRSANSTPNSTPSHSLRVVGSGTIARPSCMLMLASHVVRDVEPAAGEQVLQIQQYGVARSDAERELAATQ